MKRFLTVLFVAMLILVGTRGVVGAEAQTAVEEPEEMPLELSIVTAPERVEYYAFDSFSTEGLSVRADYPSGRWELLSPEELCIEYLTDSDRLRYGDSGVYISYRGFRILLPLEVYKREYDISELLFSSVKRTYNGGWQSIEPIGEMPVGLDGIRLSADVSGGGVDVGVYSVSLSFATESRDYRIPEPYNARLEILPHLLVVEWKNTEFTYDGSPKLPDAVAKNERGETITLSVQGEGVYASDSYVARALPPSDNYSLSGAVISYKIKKADYDVSAVRWSETSFVYDGEVKVVTLLGIPDGVTLLGYNGNVGLGAGKYTAEAILDYDTRNYNPPNIPVFLWEIAKATYDMSGVFWLGETTVYDGEEQRITLSGLPDGVSVREYIGGVGTNAGRYPVSVVFDYDEANFNPPTPCENTLVIKKKILPIPSSVSLVYDGERKSIDLSAEEYYQKNAITTKSIGRHKAELVLYDPINYAFEGGGSTARVEVTVSLSRDDLVKALAMILVALFLVFAAFVMIMKKQRLRRVLAMIRCKATHGEEILLPPPGKADGPLALMSVDSEQANDLISDSLARDLLVKEQTPIYTTGRRKSIVNVDTISEHFEPYDTVDVNSLKEKGLVPIDTAYFKVLARGTIDKPLTVLANDFSLAAVKMIALTGGEAKKVVTLRRKNKKK